jgi:hypothetical protein
MSKQSGRAKPPRRGVIFHVPRLRQRVVEDPLGVAPPRWEVDPHFDLSYHGADPEGSPNEWIVPSRRASE